jgi:hypothetical protein
LNRDRNHQQSLQLKVSLSLKSRKQSQNQCPRRYRNPQPKLLPSQQMSLQLKTHLNLLPSRPPNLFLKNRPQSLQLKSMKLRLLEFNAQSTLNPSPSPSPSQNLTMCLKNYQQTLELKCLKQNQDLSLSQQQSQRCRCLLRSLSRRNL